MARLTRCLAALSFFGIGLWAAPADDTKPPAQASVNLTLDAKSDTKPVYSHFVFAAKLRFCIAEGFPPAHEAVRVKPSRPDYYECEEERKWNKKIKWEIVNADIDDIVAALSSDSSDFILAKSGEARIVAFCRTEHCSSSVRDRLEVKILEIARPKPAYFTDYLVQPSAKDKDFVRHLAAAVANLGQGNVTGRQIDKYHIRLESDTPLEKFDLGQLLDLIEQTIAAPDSIAKLVPPAGKANGLTIPLPSFCLSGTLSGKPQQSPDTNGVCPDGFPIKVQAGNAAEIAAELKVDKVTLTSTTPYSIAFSCGGSVCGKDAIGALNQSVNNLARPPAQFIEDLPVPKGTAGQAQKIVQSYPKLNITADILSDSKIRLKSDTQLSEPDLNTLKEVVRQKAFAGSIAVPVQRLFYTDPTKIVASLSVASAPTTPTPAPAAPAATAAPTPPPAGIATGMVPVGDDVVFTDPTRNASDSDRARLLTLLDLPRPEVLMNVWSFEESSPDGREILKKTNELKNSISANNDALQNAIEYGWSYLSRQMQDPRYFDKTFYNYLTQRFVSQDPACGSDPAATPCLSQADRAHWGLCEAGSYCLGFTEAFQPLRPTLSNILLGIIAARDPFKAAFTTIGCMGGKYEVYGHDCFPERTSIGLAMQTARATSAAADLYAGQPAPNNAAADRACLARARQEEGAKIEKSQKQGQPSCEILDLAALKAQSKCGVHLALPLACFTMQAAKSFVPYHGFTTFPWPQLDIFGEAPIAALQQQLEASESSYSTTPVGLLRASIADFLFNYKLANQYPESFSPYGLSHTAQELNAQLNPLVIAFNQDVAAFSQSVMQNTEEDQYAHSWPWHNYRSVLADGGLTVRGICGIESMVDTDTQSAFNAPQFQNLATVLNSLINFQAGLSGAAPATGTTTSTTQTTNTPGQSGILPDSNAVTVTGPTPTSAGFNIQNILRGGLSPASIAAAVAAISPTAATAQIGRQLTLTVTPHALPGASAAELEVGLTAQQDSPPSLYADNTGTSQTDPISRVARHNVTTRVRLESIKLFDISSFSAIIQRPREKVPLLPPLVEIPFLDNFLALPLPGAKVFHRSSAIVSAIMVPTATDLAYGIEFQVDRTVVSETTKVFGHDFSFRRLTALGQLPDATNLFTFHRAMVNCLATNSQAAVATLKPEGLPCKGLSFEGVAPDR